MKRLLPLILAALLGLSAHPQDKTTNPAKSGKHYFIGLSYDYMNLDMKLKDMSFHSVWGGQDLGTLDLTQDEIDTINSYADRKSLLNGINLEAGMILYEKLDSKWQVRGTLAFGIARSSLSVYNNKTESEEFKFDSELSKLFFGLGFNVAYHFNSRWGLCLIPFMAASAGTTDEITDNVNPAHENFTETKEEKYNLFYERVSLMATFTAGDFTIEAGPGFYWINSHHEYTIERISTSDGVILLDEIDNKLIARSFIDGSLAAEWRIIDQLTFYAHAGIGKDLQINTGLQYNF